MKEFTYHFADGTSSTVEVEDELFATLIEMSNDERKDRRTYNRHNSPMSEFEYQGEEFADPRGDAFDILMRKKESEKIQDAIEALTESQQELIRKVYYDGMAVKAVAEEYGIDKTSVSHRLMRIRNKLKKILGIDRHFLPFSVVNSEGVD